MAQNDSDDELNLLELFIITQASFCTSAFVGYLIHNYVKQKSKKTHTSNFVYNDECPICFNILTMPIKSHCGHGYCIQCLYTYWEKPSWNNLCPLCRKPIENLQLIKDENCEYLESTKKVLLEKLKKISSTSNFSSFKFTNIGTRTVYYCIFGTLFPLLWTWAVTNIDKLIYFIMLIYDSFHENKSEINS